MRSIIDQLKQALLTKIELLDDLIQGQNAMKAFLVKPKWDQYFDMVTPQQILLKKLQDQIREQNQLTSKLAQIFGLNPRTSMSQILPQLSAQDRESLMPLFDASRKQAEKLQSLSQLSDRLMQAQHEFTAQWMTSWQSKPAPAISLYNSFGHHVHRPAVSVFQREA